MEKNTTVTLTLTQEDAQLLHAALCDYRGKLGDTINRLAGFDLPTNDARALERRVAALTNTMCAALTGHR